MSAPVNGRQMAQERENGVDGTGEPVDASEALSGPEIARNRHPARARLLRRCVAMRHQRALDRLALAAAGDYARQAAADRDAAAIAAIAPPEHLDQSPGYGAIALLHREREESARKIAEAEGRAERLQRMVDRLSDEIGQLSGRAIRAEQALQVYRVPARLAIEDQRPGRASRMEAGR